MNLIHSNDGMDGSKESLQASHSNRQINFPPIYDNDNDEVNLECSSESVLKETETNVLMDMNEEGRSATFSDDAAVVFSLFNKYFIFLLLLPFLIWNIYSDLSHWVKIAVMPSLIMRRMFLELKQWSHQLKHPRMNSNHLFIEQWMPGPTQCLSELPLFPIKSGFYCENRLSG